MASWVTSSAMPAKSRRCRPSSIRSAIWTRDVEAGEGLVEQQHVGVGGQRPGDGDPLGLAAGELARLAVGEVADAEAVQPVAGERLPRPPRLTPRARGPKATLSRARQVGEEQLALEDQPDLALADRGLQQVGVAQPGVALAGDEAGQRVQQGGLAGAVGADDAEDLAGLGGRRPPRTRSVTRRSAIQAVHGAGAHGVPSQRSRSGEQHADETTSITRLSDEGGVLVGLRG